MAYVTDTQLAADDGSSLVGHIALGTGAVSRTVQSKLRDLISVIDYGAVGDGVADDASAIQAAMDYAATLPRGGTVHCPPGVYACGDTLAIPAYVTLFLDGAQIENDGAVSPLVAMAVGTDGASGALVGREGRQNIISYTGTGWAVEALGAKQPRADIMVANIWIAGTSAGAGGLRMRAFNRANTLNLKVMGFTAGDGIRSEGANAVTHFNPQLTSNLNGLHNMTAIDGGVPQTSNNVNVYGGSIGSNSGWGWWEDPAGGGGLNIGNSAIGVQFEDNGTDGSATSGHLFIQQGLGFSLSQCYLEFYSTNAPDNAVVLGDATNTAFAVEIVGNVFLTPAQSVNTINSVRAQTTFCENNAEGGNVPTFYNHGAASTNLSLGFNHAPAVTSYISGTDAGLISLASGGSGTYTNQHFGTPTGYGFNAVSGLNQDLRIRTRSGGTYCARFYSSAGFPLGYVDDSGNLSAVSFQVGGTKVVGARGAAVADASGGSTVDTQARAAINSLLARMRTHGLIAT